MESDSKLKAAYRRNLNCIIKMRDKAIATGKKVNGYTVEKLTDQMERYTAIVNMSDDELLYFVEVNYASITSKGVGVDPRTLKRA